MIETLFDKSELGSRKFSRKNYLKGNHLDKGKNSMKNMA